MSASYTPPAAVADYSSIVDAVQQSVIDLEEKTQADFETRLVDVSGVDQTASVRSTEHLYEVSMHNFVSGDLEVSE